MTNDTKTSRSALPAAATIAAVAVVSGGAFFGSLLLLGWAGPILFPALAAIGVTAATADVARRYRHRNDPGARPLEPGTFMQRLGRRALGLLRDDSPASLVLLGVMWTLGTGLALGAVAAAYFVEIVAHATDSGHAGPRRQRLNQIFSIHNGRRSLMTHGGLALGAAALGLIGGPLGALAGLGAYGFVVGAAEARVHGRVGHPRTGGLAPLLEDADTVRALRSLEKEGVDLHHPDFSVVAIREQELRAVRVAARQARIQERVAPQSRVPSATPPAIPAMASRAPARVVE